jgi:hypothetical protein
MSAQGGRLPDDDLVKTKRLQSRNCPFPLAEDLKHCAEVDSKAKAVFYIEVATRLRGKILAARDRKGKGAIE